MKHFSFTLSGRAGFVAATALLLNACAPGQDTPTPTAAIDLSHYLAVGDSYTAGFSAGGLTRTSQQYSFPNLMAQQFALASGGGSFTQPTLEAGTGTGYLNLLDFTATGQPRARRVAGAAVRRSVIDPAACGGPDTVRLFTRSATASALPQNLGVPGLKLSQIEVAGLGNETNATPGGAFNPYFERLLPAADSRTYLQAVTTAASSATFFTYFQGLDELMPYIRSGGTCGTVSTSLAETMKLNARKILDVLAANGRKGIIMRLPDIKTLPLLRQGQGKNVEARLQAFYHDNALIYIESPFVPGTSQPITDEDYILATALPRIGQLTPVQVGSSILMLPYGRDARNPIRNADVLEKASELNILTGIITTYNGGTSRALSLEGLAKLYKLPIVDPAQSLYTLDTGLLFTNVGNSVAIGGVVYSAEPVRGNFFSLDYYTLTPRGNALLANTCITAINRAYQANIPAVDVNKLPTTAQ
ncbi:hypothetical protein [Hymenobacter negativus]|uniref:G-D-S-L family lipolytic protein n=1 Tax=Hymenobacter negativus TaxID=2795026 RepID=A0ABS0Q6W9_9BACT|nr:hypothetical protein [Hymenobacter negativus]MBH8558332.1 hypothetical protein [Hymenobacter negativus]